MVLKYHYRIMNSRYDHTAGTPMGSIPGIDFLERDIIGRDYICGIFP